MPAQENSDSGWNPDWSTGPLASGLACYRSLQYWAAHEHWEIVWLTLPEPEKTFLRALIQLTAAFHHVSTGNFIGAASLLQKSLQKLESRPEVFGGIDVSSLRVEIAQCLACLSSGTLLTIPPKIRPVNF